MLRGEKHCNNKCISHYEQRIKLENKIYRRGLFNPHLGSIIIRLYLTLASLYHFFSLNCLNLVQFTNALLHNLHSLTMHLCSKGLINHSVQAAPPPLLSMCASMRRGLAAGTNYHPGKLSFLNGAGKHSVRLHGTIKKKKKTGRQNHTTELRGKPVRKMDSNGKSVKKRNHQFSSTHGKPPLEKTHTHTHTLKPLHKEGNRKVVN